MSFVCAALALLSKQLTSRLVGFGTKAVTSDQVELTLSGVLFVLCAYVFLNMKFSNQVFFIIIFPWYTTLVHLKLMTATVASQRSSVSTISKWVFSCVPLAFLAMWITRGPTECEWRAPQWRPGHLDSAGWHPGPGMAAIPVCSHIAILISHPAFSPHGYDKLSKTLCVDCIQHLIRHWDTRWLATGSYLSSNKLHGRWRQSLVSKAHLI